jgi:hypothetical protein
MTGSTFVHLPERWVYRTLGPNRAQRRADGVRQRRSKRRKTQPKLIFEPSINTPYIKEKL